MKKKKINWAEPFLNKEDEDFIVKALKSTWISGGEYVEKFESQTAEYINSWNMSYSQGNVVKYVTRYNLKHEDLRKQREDLAKAKWYLNDLIVQLEKKIDTSDN